MAYVAVPAAGGGGGTVATASLPLLITGSDISINAATTAAAGSFSAADKTKADATYLFASGTALTDGSATIQPGTDLASQYAAAVAETANRTTTLGTTSATTGQSVYILRTSTAAFTRAIVNGGTNGGTLYTHPASQAKTYVSGYQYNGTDWVLLGVWFSA